MFAEPWDHRSVTFRYTPNSEGFLQLCVSTNAAVMFMVVGEFLPCSDLLQFNIHSVGEIYNRKVSVLKEYLNLYCDV